MAGWKQLDTIQETFGATGAVALLTYLPANTAPSGSARFLIENRGAADAHIATADDIATGIPLTAARIPPGGTRYTTTFPWPVGPVMPSLYGLIGADCIITPEIRGH